MGGLFDMPIFGLAQKSHFRIVTLEGAAHEQFVLDRFFLLYFVDWM